MLNETIQSLLTIIPVYIGIGTIVLWIMLLFIKICSSVLDDTLDKKAICADCQSVHKKDFVFLNLPFCNIECWKNFCSKVPVEELIEISKQQAK